MKDKVIRILSTRPLDEAVVAEAVKQQLIVDTISFIQTRSLVNTDVSDKIKELALKSITAVFTSMNAVDAVVESLRESALQPEWNIYSLGATTESLIRKYFIRANITGTGNDALELAELIIRNKVEKVVFFCGNQRREELPGELKKNNIEVKEVVVYETDQIPVKADKEYNGILFFSPSAVKSFFSVNSIPAATVLFSIGNTTANAIRENSNNKVIVSEFPSKNKLLEIAIRYFKCEK